MSNSIEGGFMFKPPTNATSCIVTDASTFGSPYCSVVQGFVKGGSQKWCGTNTVTFPVNASNQYSFTAYIMNSPPPPANGQTVTLQILWQ